MVEEQLRGRSGLRLRLAKEGIYIGFLAGVLIVGFRLLLNLLEKYLPLLFSYIHRQPIFALIGLLLILGVSFISYTLLRYEPLISGSGIPQVQGEIQGQLRPHWSKVLPAKFVGGLLSLGMGLTMGREGPSVQLGAATGKMYAVLSKRPLLEHNFLLSAGAAAGLGAAFNAPLAGVVFALEEAHRNFSVLALLPAMTAAIVADFLSKTVFGLEPVLHFDNVLALPLSQYYLLLPLGVLISLSGLVFNRGILFTKKLYQKVPLHPYYKILIPFLVTSVVVFFFPLLLGSGHNLIHFYQDYAQATSFLPLILVIKFGLLLLAFGSGLAGGIFFPLLVLGSLVGQIYALSLNYLNLLDERYILFLLILAMAGHFTAIVRAPLTGILLLSEMTGSFAYFLPLALITAIVYITSEWLKNEPIYESLLENLLKQKGKQDIRKKEMTTDIQSSIEEGEDREVQVKENIKTHSYNRTHLFEVPIIVGSQVAGFMIRDFLWPKDILLVAVKRGTQEILPKGDTILRPGDYIVAMCLKEEFFENQKKLEAMCGKVD